MVRHDNGASAIFRYEFGHYDNSFLVFDYLLHNPSILDEELLLYVRLHLLKKILDYALTVNPVVDFWLIENEEYNGEIKQAA